MIYWHFFTTYEEMKEISSSKVIKYWRKRQRRGRCGRPWISLKKCVCFEPHLKGLLHEFYVAAIKNLFVLLFSVNIQFGGLKWGKNSYLCSSSLGIVYVVSNRFYDSKKMQISGRKKGKGQTISMCTWRNVSMVREKSLNVLGKDQIEHCKSTFFNFEMQ